MQYRRPAKCCAVSWNPLEKSDVKTRPARLPARKKSLPMLLRIRSNSWGFALLALKWPRLRLPRGDDETASTADRKPRRCCGDGVRRCSPDRHTHDRGLDRAFDGDVRF